MAVRRHDPAGKVSIPNDNAVTDIK